LDVFIFSFCLIAFDICVLLPLVANTRGSQHDRDLDLIRAVDRILDEVKSPESLPLSHIPRLVSQLVALLNFSNWHLIQAVLYGIMHIIKQVELPKLKEFLYEPNLLLSHLLNLLGDKKREVRDAASQVISQVQPGISLCFTRSPTLGPGYDLH